MARTEPDVTAAANDGRRSIQSIEVGCTLLTALVEAATPLSLRDLAQAAGMTSAKAHPYLVSFIRVGLVQQDGVTGHYELGAFALQMGLVSLQRLDPVRAAMPELAQLRDEIGHTLGIAVLGSHGPTMVHMSQASYPVHVNMRQGTVMSMLHTATGLVFAAWLPPKVADHFIAREIGDTAVISSIDTPVATPRPTLDAMLADIRVHGMARALGNPLPGVDALSVPVFDNTGSVVLALTSLGPTGRFDTAYDGVIARPLLRCAQAISRKLGYTGR